MAWHPDHFDADGVTGSKAFDTNDLRGRARYVSVDRQDLYNREAAIARARDQQARAWAKADAAQEPRPKLRAVNVELPCGGVREATDSAGVRPFTVTEAWLPENHAHCAIRNVTGNEGPSYANGLRTMLFNLVVGEEVLLEEEVPAAAHEPDPLP